MLLRGIDFNHGLRWQPVGFGVRLEPDRSIVNFAVQALESQVFHGGTKISFDVFNNSRDRIYARGTG